MNELVIVDTDILIDAARNVSDAVQCLEQIERHSSLAISIITQMELLIGCRNKTELRKTKRFLRRFQTIKLNEAMCDIALELLHQYRLSHGLSIPDTMIAATAMFLNISFVSKNQRHYRYIRELKLLPYPAVLS